LIGVIVVLSRRTTITAAATAVCYPAADAL
jgi:hypothetical protein